MRFIRFLSLILIILFIVSVVGCEKGIDNKSYLRIHIRANSNSDNDQNIKYEVKSHIVEYITPFLTNCTTKNDAINMINLYSTNLKEIADRVLLDNGFTYESEIKILEEFFPTRVYDGLVLASDYYDAIIINLGSGLGDNWWCVVYPPLCFNGETNNIVYKSKIKEIIDGFFNNK